jgi:hypothetical protein
MLKRFTHMFAYLLLVLMPLQSIAAANMLVCNSMMQSHTSNIASKQEVSAMPCHEHMANMAASTNMTDSKHKDACKSTCGTLCSTLCAMTALASDLKTAINSNSSHLVSLTEQSYVSVTLPNTQRPPILLS